ncbi:MAG TPA: hypothetical protein DEH05_04660 [Propionibacteriaceae bacterium]|nr:hypothetical protein [Propionibacteriaceae bacterium]
MLIAESLLLCIYPDEGRALLVATAVDVAVAGAVMAELALSGHVRLGEKGETSVKKGKITVNTDLAPPTDPLLVRGLEFIATSHWKTPSSVLQVAQSDWRQAVRARLVAAEILSDQRGSILGIPTHHWRVIDTRPRTELLDRLDAVLFNGAPADPETATLAGLLYATGITVPVMKRGRLVDAKPLKKAAKAYCEQSWPATATMTALQVLRAASASGG